MNLKKFAMAGALAILVIMGIRWLKGGSQVETVIHFELGDAKGPIRADLWLNDESVAFYEHQGDSNPRAWALKTASGDFLLSLSYRDHLGRSSQSKRVITLSDGATLRVPVNRPSAF